MTIYIDENDCRMAVYNVNYIYFATHGEVKSN